VKVELNIVSPRYSRFADLLATRWKCSSLVAAQDGGLVPLSWTAGSDALKRTFPATQQVGALRAAANHPPPERTQHSE